MVECALGRAHHADVRSWRRLERNLGVAVAIGVAGELPIRNFERDLGVLDVHLHRKSRGAPQRKHRHLRIGVVPHAEQRHLRIRLRGRRPAHAPAPASHVHRRRSLAQVDRHVRHSLRTFDRDRHLGRRVRAEHDVIGPQHHA
jgi:hypothetical protein